MSEIKPRQWTVKWGKIQITENYYEGVQIADGISERSYAGQKLSQSEWVIKTERNKICDSNNLRN